MKTTTQRSTKKAGSPRRSESTRATREGDDASTTYFDDKLCKTLVGWYVYWDVSYRVLQEMMVERGLPVHHSTLNRWVVRWGDKVEQKRHEPWNGWKVQEEQVQIKGEPRYLYLAIGNNGAVLDIFLSKSKSKSIAEKFFTDTLTNVICRPGKGKRKAAA